MEQQLLEHILNISRQMAEKRHLDTLLHYVIAEALELVEAERGFVVLVADDGQLDFRVKRTRDGQEVKRARDQISTSILKKVVEEGEPLVLRDAMFDPRFAQARSVHALELRSVMCVPLITSGNTIGAIYVENRSFHGRFDDDDVTPLILFANQAAIAIENAHLYGHLEQKVKERTEDLQQEITERKRAEERAKAASQAKSAFLANMSHELRTPLNGILGYAQILQRDRNLTPEQLEKLGIIYRSGHHLLTLINDVLDLSKIEANRLELEPSQFELTNFLAELVSMMRIAAQQKSVRFNYENNLDRQVQVVGDKKRLRQVLLNLLGNAIKFTEEGQVTIRVESRPAAEEEAQSAYFHFEVEDSGPGITAEKLAAIFQPFEQVGDARQQAEGTGLGLAISQQLVGKMGGKIEVESVLEEGSCFSFELLLPAVWGGAERPSPLSPPQQMILGYDGPRRQILAIDDKKENLQLIADLLQPLDFDVILADNGHLGLQLAEEKRPDLILLDLVMPKMDGFEVVKQIRRTKSLAQTPVVAVSASVFEQDQARSLEVGCNRFLAKPVEADELLATLQEQLQLVWRYEETAVVPHSPTTPKKQELVPPPTDHLQILHQLARYGNMERIEEQARQLAQTNTYRPFAEHLQKLAADFEDEAILTLIEQFLTEEAS